MRSPHDKLLVYFAPVPLNSPAQRPHFFAQYIRDELGWDVLWINPPPGRLPRLEDIRRANTGRGPNYGLDGVQSATVRALPLEPLPILRHINDFSYRRLFRAIDKQQCQYTDFKLAVGRPSRLALLALSRWPDRALFYDAMDDFPQFFSGLSYSVMARIEAEIANAVPHVAITSKALQIKFNNTKGEIHRIQNAFDAGRCVGRAGREKRTVAGYMGTIGSWFDWSFLIDAALAHPHYEFPIIGPVFTHPTGPLPANVKLLGELPHHQAMRAALEFDVGLIPFKVNSLTEAVDPVKYYEYRALGLPVCSAWFGEMKFRGFGDYVIHYSQSNPAAIAIDAAMNLSISDAELRIFREENNWTRRFSDLRNIFPA